MVALRYEEEPMSLLRSLSGGLRSLFRKQRVEGELDEELRGFLEMAAEETMKQGMSRKHGLRAMRLERGNIESTKEGAFRSAAWEPFVETCWQDLGFGVRRIRKNPGFAAVAVLTMTLDIGTTASIFNRVGAVLLRCCPVIGQMDCDL
jgi:macrolide transport system ATP-binding/permease protein